MADSPINLADLTVFGIILVSALFAFARGLIKELLSIGAWVGGAFAAIYGLPYLEPFVLTFVSEPFIARALTAALIFVATLVMLSLISHLIAGRIKDSMLSALDRSLGFLFGVLRGGVLISLAFLVLTLVRPPEKYPRVLREAKTAPFMEMGADALRQLVPEGVRPLKAAGSIALQRRAVEALMDARRTPPGGPVDSAAPGAVSGYNSRARKDMERLIQSTQ